MTTLNYACIKTTSTAKENEQKRTDAREKAMLLFAFQLLVDKGYADTAATFASECSLDLSQFVMCENIDLQSIFIEFETYHNLRFQRYPMYFRKLNSTCHSGESLLSKLHNKRQGSSRSRTIPRRAQMEDEDGNQSVTTADPFIDMAPSVQGFSNVNNPHFQSQVTLDGKLLKPISGLDFPTEETRSLAKIIQKDIIVTDLGVKWNDVVGLDNAKMILMESLVYSKEFTDFFGTAFPPWRGLLLYGPPGNGKTLLAKAVANECKTTFFNISSSSIVSKWRGESEKLLKILFELAKYHAPSTIFFDEFDALGSCRDSAGESDASRRLKSELLQQLDGLLSQNNNKCLPIFVLAATNIPWDLDPAILRRFEKRIHIPLPDASSRRDMLQAYFERAMKSVSESSRGKHAIIGSINFDLVASATEGYSGSDLHQIVKECIVRKFRQQFSNPIKKLTIETDDMITAIQAIPPTVKSQLKEKFKGWDARYGAS